jgi:hypothetical protein
MSLTPRRWASFCGSGDAVGEVIDGLLQPNKDVTIITRIKTTLRYIFLMTT